jgi:hypothetical protein
MSFRTQMQFYHTAALEDIVIACDAAKQKQNQVVRELAAAGRHDLKDMDVMCTHCQAWHWKAE